MKAKKNIKSFIREEDWKAIKKSLLISSLWLVLGFWLSWNDAWAVNSHKSATNSTSHSSTHSNHSNHSSY